jgi:hypothetical protein
MYLYRVEACVATCFLCTEKMAWCCRVLPLPLIKSETRWIQENAKLGSVSVRKAYIYTDFRSAVNFQIGAFYPGEISTVTEN